MPDNSQFDSSMLDDALASFTDRLLGGESSESTISDSEFRDLQVTTSQLARALKASPPDPEMAQRIRANLAAQWQRTMPVSKKASVQPKVGWWDRIRGTFIDESDSRWQSKRSLQQTYGFGLAGIAAILVIILAIAGVIPIESMPGTAIGTPLIAAGAVVVGFVLGVAAWYFLRRKR